MKQFKRAFLHYIRSQNLFQPQQRLLVGVSGGLDSVVLCHLLQEHEFDFELAHVNFQLRGAESDRDEQFVTVLAASLNRPFHVAHLEAAQYSRERGVSIQVAARELRYDWFAQLVTCARETSQPLEYILTAHHANDNAETILMNLFRGTGLAGLRGILPARGNLRRPLLFATRKDLEAYAQENDLQWVEDSSNAAAKYTRNAIRLEILPAIEQVFPQVVDTLQHSAAHFRDLELLVEETIRFRLRKLLRFQQEDQMIPVNGWRKLSGAQSLLHSWLLPYGFAPAQIPEVMALANSETGHYVDSATHRVLINRNWLVLTPLKTTVTEHFLLVEDHGTIDYKSGRIEWLTRDADNRQPSDDPNQAWLDAGKIAYPLLLRPWRPGDYFYPLGMPKKKKIARFLGDIKMPRHKKDGVWVLESNQKIIWVVGHRIDDRFKVKPSTRKLLCLKFNTAI